MKTFYAILYLAIASLTQLQAQAPQGFNYQATVRSAGGELIVNQNVYFKFNVIQGSLTSVPVFTETHYVPTDDLGQVNLIIGQGSATLGAFSELDWSLGNYYLGIELDTDTGNSYVAMGTTQLLSVPYALYAENSGNDTLSIPTLDSVLAENNSANNQQIKDLADPIDDQDAVTKIYTYSKAEVDELLTALNEKIDLLENLGGLGTVTDIDGNTYDYLTYGAQKWTVENAEMVTYRDGTPIPEVTGATEWSNLTTGAWAYYENDPSKHRLYNWYAVMGIHDTDDSTPNKEFAPEGWHVPSNTEWITLEEHLIANGYNYDGTTTGNKIGKAMASTTGWTSSTLLGAPSNDQSTNNSSGFNGFPEGYRGNGTGSFGGYGSITCFWSSTKSPSNQVWDRYLLSSLYRFEFADMSDGFSVRFLKGNHANDIDNDNDGYTENQGDCDDTDASINPSAVDLTDGIDNNCDGIVDNQIDEISNLLTGTSTVDDIGSSQTWYWQGETDGYVGLGPVDDEYGFDNPSWWSIDADANNLQNCMLNNEFTFTRTTNGVTFEQSGPVFLNSLHNDEFGLTAENCYDESVITSIAGVKDVSFLASTSQAALQGSYGENQTVFTKASMLFSGNGFMGWYAGHNLAQIEYEIILISENELVVRFVDSNAEYAWYSRFQTENINDTDDDNDGYTESEGDCNDTDASINPAATEIIDGIDNDCDGDIDEGLELSGTFIDVDGNTYNYLYYGTQAWTVDNAEMETYRDGTPIPQVTDPTAWSSLTTGAWSYYDNDPSKPRLYNWYAVMGIHDTDESTPNKGFAPEGWHVPTDAEWTTLEEHLIANSYNYDGTTTGNKIAKAMASITGWDSTTDTGAIGNDQTLNNSSGFNSFPEGDRFYDGSFNFEGNNAFFWSSTEFDSNRAWYRFLYRNLNYLGRGDGSDGVKRYGLSVRFVRD